MRIHAAVLTALAALPAVAEETDFTTFRYLCDRGVEVPVTYVNAWDLSLAVIHVEGTQITLVNEVSASGARYGWPSDGAHYVWWTKGEEATLYWAEGDDETQLLSCKAQE